MASGFQTFSNARHWARQIRRLYRLLRFQHGSERFSFVACPAEHPIGTAYAVWTGIGALGTFLVGILWFGDSSNIWRMLAASFLLIGIIGLKLAPGH